MQSWTTNTVCSSNIFPCYSHPNAALFLLIVGQLVKPSETGFNEQKFASPYLFEFLLLAQRAFKLETREKASNIARIAQTLVS